MLGEKNLLRKSCKVAKSLANNFRWEKSWPAGHANLEAGGDHWPFLQVMMWMIWWVYVPGGYLNVSIQSTLKTELFKSKPVENLMVRCPVSRVAWHKKTEVAELYRFWRTATDMGSRAWCHVDSPSDRWRRLSGCCSCVKLPKLKKLI